MNRIEHIVLMANYNQWMNRKLYDAASTLTDAELAADRQAFFGSILGTLNHLALGDTVWLKRFAQHPAGFSALAPLSAIATPTDLKQLAFADLRVLSAHRAWLDQLIIEWGAQPARFRPGPAPALSQHARRREPQAVLWLAGAFFQSPDPPPRPGNHAADPSGRGCRRHRPAGTD